MNLVVALLLIFAQQASKAPDPAIFCKDAKDKTLCAELLSIRDRDQEVRHRWIADMKNEALKAEAEKVDKEDLVRIEAIIAQYGWPTRSLVGRSAGDAAWIVIQHADLATQKKYLDMMTKAADTGDLYPALLATTVDRIRVREGKAQVYGRSSMK